MASITSIRLIRNRTGATGEVGGAGRYDVAIRNRESPGDTNGEGRSVPIPANNERDYFQCAMWIPWFNEGEFDNKVIEISLFEGGGGGHVTTLKIYQRDGYIYYRQGETDYLVSGNGHEGGDRTVDVTGTSADNADLTFY